MQYKIKAVLFDLDGTLMDTAPDLTAAMNILLVKYGKTPVNQQEFRNYIHGGSPTMLGFAFKLNKDDPQYLPVRDEFLQIYYENLVIKTRLFAGMGKVLNYLDREKMPWGIVTNKPSWLAESLLKHFNLTRRMRCLIAGDTLPQRKPDPQPLLKACEILQIPATQTAYVGDTEMDAIAAQAAKMLSFSVCYGYAPQDRLPGTWPTDYLFQSAQDIIPFLEKCNDESA